jgi:Group II intron, maturase-specific domain.
MSDIIKTQRSFATKALHQPTHRFDPLYRIICQREWLETALESVLANKGARTPGIDGLEFLGFHVRRYISGHDRPKLLVMPSDKAQQRLKTRIKEMTARRRFRDSPLLKFGALNAVLRGWITYYRHSNVKETAKALDFWVNQRLFRWL